MTETAFMKRAMLEAHRHGLWLLRNNVGTATTMDGRFIRFGLAPGSSDLIGITEYVVQPGDVGRTLGVFTACETKAARGRVSAVQQNFIDAVKRHGGFAGVLREQPNVSAAVAAFRKDIEHG
jgi:hypothetical protein